MREEIGMDKMNVRNSGNSRHAQGFLHTTAVSALPLGTTVRAHTVTPSSTVRSMVKCCKMAIVVEGKCPSYCMHSDTNSGEK